MSPDPSNTRTDAELVARAIEGDDAAFRDLVIRYQHAAFACAGAITRNDADAADAAQEAFIRFHRNMTQFDPARALKPYLLRIVANCSRNLLAKRSRCRELADWQTAAPGPPAVQPSPVAAALRTERRTALRAMVDALPATLREVCSLFYFAECSCREVAETLGMNENAVKVALHRARKRLLANGAGAWRTVT